MTKRIVLLQALASTPVDVARIVRPLNGDDELLRWQPASEEWSVAAVLIHFAQVERAYRHRLQRIAAEDAPHVPYIHPEVSDIPADASAAELLQDFEAERSQTITFLQELPPGGWQRPVIHETKGRTTMRYQVQDLVDHDINHTSQLVNILQQWRKHTKMRLEIGN